MTEVIIPSFQKFLTYMPLILQYEGGFCDVPGDSGGATNMGVIQSEYDAYRLTAGLTKQSVKFITMNEVHAIYYTSYYRANNCDLMPSGLDFLVFDTSINMGIGTAAEFLKQAIGLSEGPRVVSDAVLSFLREDWADPGKGLIIVDKFAALRHARYVQIATIPHDTKFLVGWLNRLTDVLEYILPIIRKEGVNMSASICQPSPPKTTTARTTQTEFAKTNPLLVS